MNCAFNYNYFKAFLIVLPLFILLLFISCSNEDKTGGRDNGGGEIGTNDNTGDGGSSSGNTVAHELEGTWFGYDKTHTTHENYKLEFTVDSDGNIIFYPKPVPSDDGSLYRYRYTAKVETNSIVYPYKIEISNNILIESGWLDGGAFEFKNSSNCAVNYDRINHNRADGFDKTGVTVEFTKQ